jgi:DNA-binding transcriptional LysR family regulator
MGLGMSMQWNLEQLRLFVSVAEQRSFSAVARKQRKAQSAVSSSIALLEEDLGVSLFERSSGRQPKLTEAGNALLEEAREVLRQCERLNGRALAMMRGRKRVCAWPRMRPCLTSRSSKASKRWLSAFPAWKCN